MPPSSDKNPYPCYVGLFLTLASDAFPAVTRPMLSISHRPTLCSSPVRRWVLQGYDPDKDVAVLKIDAPPTNLRPIPIGVSAAVKVSSGSIAAPLAPALLGRGIPFSSQARLSIVMEMYHVCRALTHGCEGSSQTTDRLSETISTGGRRWGFLAECVWPSRISG